MQTRQYPRQTWPCPARILTVTCCVASLHIFGSALDAESTEHPINAASSPVEIISPDQRLIATLHLPTDRERRTLRLEISRDQQPVARVLRLGLLLADGEVLGAQAKVRNVVRQSRDTTYRVFPGKSSTARENFHAATIELVDQRDRRIDVVIRAFNDGVAFRYRVPEQAAIEVLRIRDEQTTFTLPHKTRAYALPVGVFETNYESRYNVGPVSALPVGKLIGLPLLAELEGGPWLAITEAALTDYAGMYIARDEGQPATLSARLAPRRDEQGVAVLAKPPLTTPWRVVMIADTPGRLIESNLILNLNVSPAIDDTSWIEPGKTTFPWWNGYALKGTGFDGGLNTATMLHYIDFCAEHGIEYHSLDGFQNVAWYGGPIRPYQGQDITTARPGIDLDAVLSRARKKGVRLRLWMHWQAAKQHMDRAFPLYEKWGIEGVMVDFLDRDDQQTVQFVHRLCKKAAEHRLTVTLHGIYKPTGLRRTYPNLLTREAVRSLEYNKWDEAGIAPRHEVIVPFVRMLAGPLDFHQGGFRAVGPAEYRPQNRGPVVVGTRARQLAMYVAYENYLPMVGDYPAAYRDQPGLELIADIPVTWDETRVLAASVGEYLCIARRSGTTWYIGTLNDATQRSLRIPLTFLGGGEYAVETYSDAVSIGEAAWNRNALRHDQQLVRSTDTIEVILAPAGGHVARIDPK